MTSKLLICSLAIVLSVSNCMASWSYHQLYFSQNDFNLGFSLPESDDGFTFVGGTTGLSKNEIYVMRTDNDGDILWAKSYAALFNCFSTSATRLKDSSIIITGIIDLNQFVYKIDRSGNLLWEKLRYVGHNSPIYSVPTDDFGMALAYTNYDFGCSCSKIHLTKIDSSGTVEWTRVMGDTVGYGVSSIVRTNDNGFILAGGTGEGNMLAVKTDSSGFPQWVKRYSNHPVMSDVAHKIHQTNSMKYVMKGYIRNNLYDAVVGLDSAGNLEWFFYLTGAHGGLNIIDLEKGHNNHFILTGTLPDAVKTNLFAAEFDSAGNVLTNLTIDAGDDLSMYSAEFLSDSTLMLNASILLTGQYAGYKIKTPLFSSACNVGTGAVIKNPTTFVMIPVNMIWTSAQDDFIPLGGITVSPVTFSKTTLCSISGIRENPKVKTQFIFPNPASFSISIVSDETPIISNATVRIYNLNGGMVFEGPYLEERIDVSRLPAGLYFLTLRGEECFFTSRFLISR